MRTALISTGVGALVVALGLIVENWRAISVYLGFINEDLEKQQNLIESNLSNLDFELKLLEAQEKILKEQGKSTVAIKEEQKKIILLQQEQNQLLLENLELQLEKEKAQIREVTQWEKIKIAALKAAGAYDLAAKEIAKSVVGGDDDRERLAALTKQLQEGQLRAEKLKLALLTVDNPDSNTGGKSKRAKQVSVSDGLLSNEDQTEKLSRLSKQFEEVFNLKEEQQKQLDELGKKGVEEALNNQAVLAAAEEKARQDTLVQVKILRAQEVEYAKQGLDAISNVLGKSSAAGKSVAVASALINTYQGISAELATKTATPFEFGLKIANIASVTAIGFKAVKDILKTKLPSFAGSAGGGGGGGGVSAPSFNVVGNSGVSQIAQTLNQEQDPVQAFVVGNNVTTQQELDRNIVNTATLG